MRLHLTFTSACDPADEARHRKKNATSDTLKNLSIKTKAWNFKKQPLQSDMQTNTYKKQGKNQLYPFTLQPKLSSYTNTSYQKNQFLPQKQ